MGTILLNTIIAIIILILLNVVISIYSKIYDIKYKKIKQRNDLYIANINTDIDKSVSELLDMIIEECFNEYMVLNVWYKELSYINNELENQICSDVANLVGDRISPTLIDKLSLLYNSDKIGEVIAKRTYIFVLNYTVQTNKPKLTKLKKK